MKKFLLLFCIILATGCKKKGCTDPTAINYNQHAEQNDGTCEYNQYDNLLTGTITQDLTLTSDKIWTLQGRVAVTSGATLTIEPGTIIKAVAGTGANSSCLIIARGAMINAQGTLEQPIIFTTIADDITQGQVYNSSLDESVNGLWGGLIILGHAPVSVPGNMQSMQIEGIPASDPNGLYGGSNAQDNSGILQYISIRHGGANIGEGNEINGLTLAGVGSETIISNIEVVANQDDGIELFGGTVNVDNIIVWGCGDDLLDIDQSYNADITNAYLIPTANTDHAMEIDGGEGTLNTAFTITNAHIQGLSAIHTRAEAIGYVDVYATDPIDISQQANVVINLLPTSPYALPQWTLAYHKL